MNASETFYHASGDALPTGSVLRANFRLLDLEREAVVAGAAQHLAFYTGWPKAMAAMIVVKRVFRGDAN